MKAVNHEVVGYKLIGDAFELCNGQGYGVAGQLQPGGLPDISRGLSASDTPGTPSKTNRTLEGCQNSSVWPLRNQLLESLAPLQGASSLPPLSGVSPHSVRLNPRLMSAKPSGSLRHAISNSSTTPVL